ncbi:McrC family protein [Luteimonas sp. MC1825]|uniref:McrC family protein n=1 Tax=Luteimonas sp. MC1825 TaxID=2761107 RepID=UPI00161B1DB0|nr:McrC family protein [Luteimonas sp. MC1825]MBB6600309.1 McrC family protein [Luteimonas sp. MC1825]QOC87988.1 McrC family protein [Luteimonas sp. MC1825]
MHTVTVREYARITTGPMAVANGLDQATVSDVAFDWLCKESERLRKAGAGLVQLEGRRWLRLDNYVGVIEAPDGTRIEILPKTFDEGDDATQARRLLQKMLQRCLHLDPRISAPTGLLVFDGPLTEWVIQQFLTALETLVKRGLRFEYHAVEEERRFLRGRLLVGRQLRQPPGRAHYFQVEHEVFDADRPENRLLRSALDKVCRHAKEAGNRRLAYELAHQLHEIPPSRDFAKDFDQWRSDRLTAHYRSVRPWCSLILNEQNPLTVLGDWTGHSLLFPMEQVFESYVEGCIRRALRPGQTLKAQAASQYLATHDEHPWFQLRPDFLLFDDGATTVLDAKWKRLDASKGDSVNKYGLSQADFYQLYAYGQKYLGGRGQLVLLYPQTATFRESLLPFFFNDQLRLDVMPFDLTSEHAVGWPSSS